MNKEPGSEHPTPPPPSGKRRGVFVAIVGTATVGVLASVLVIPNLIEGRKHKNETSAIGALARIGEAQSLFREGDREGDGNLDYGTLAELGAAGLIDEVLASGLKNGYVFEASYGPLTSEFIWMATARPFHPGSDGDRYFAMNHEGTTFMTTGSPFVLAKDCMMPPGAVSG